MFHRGSARFLVSKLPTTTGPCTAFVLDGLYLWLLVSFYLSISYNNTKKKQNRLTDEICYRELRTLPFYTMYSKTKTKKQVF